MKKYILLIFLFAASAAYSQTYTINGQAIRFANRLGIPLKDTTAALWSSAADTVVLTIRPQDSTLYYRYKGRWRSSSEGSGSSTDSLIFATVARLNKLRDSLGIVKLNVSDTASMLSPYARTTALGDYLPLTGGTLTGGLTGTTGSFASSGSGNTFAINHSSGSGLGLDITKGGNGEGLKVNKTSGSGNAATIVGTLEATSLVRTGGTSSQFLKADGSVDGNAYTRIADTAAMLSPYARTTALGAYLPLTGGTLTPPANTTALGISGYSLTGSNAQPAVDISGTWNTTGTPTLIRANVTNTASDIASLLMDLRVGGVSQFSVRRDGTVASNLIGTTTTNFTGTTMSITRVINGGGGNMFQTSYTYSPTFQSGDHVVNRFTTSFTPPATTNSGSVNSIGIFPTVNQTVGGTAVTRAIWVNPTLTSAADWRSIEWSNNTGWGLFGSGTSSNWLRGRTIIGGASAVDNGTDALQVNGSGRFSGQVTIAGTTGDIIGNRNTLFLRNANATGNRSNAIVFGSADNTNTWAILNDLDAIGTQVNQLRILNNGNSRLTIDSTGAATFNSTVNSVGHFTAITTTTSDLTLGATHSTVIVNPSSGNVTITLPSASGNTGRIYTITRRSDGNTLNTLSVVVSGGGTIDGNITTYELVNAYTQCGWPSGITVQSDGSTWHVINTKTILFCEPN